MPLIRASARDPILDAAESIVRECGAGHLTLDGVAARAGVSKGGLLYHFPSKEALLQAMVERQLGYFQKAQAEARANLPEGPGCEIQAFISASFKGACADTQVCNAMLAAGANNPELLEPIRKYYKELVRTLAESDLGLERSAILWLATEGLWLLTLLKLSPLTQRQRDAIQARLMELASRQF